jgi:DNA-directed RNA polymerase specialized sigma24 family protein
VTASEEREFSQLWTDGLTTATIAQRLSIPVGTVKSRAHTLAHAGKLTARPRGGPIPGSRR